MWLGLFYVITDVIDKQSYSNAPGQIHGTFEYDFLSMTSVMTQNEPSHASSSWALRVSSDWRLHAVWVLNKSRQYKCFNILPHRSTNIIAIKSCMGLNKTRNCNHLPSIVNHVFERSRFIFNLRAPFANMDGRWPTITLHTNRTTPSQDPFNKTLRVH
jgi:hypothetical protein